MKNTGTRGESYMEFQQSCGFFLLISYAQIQESKNVLYREYVQS